MSTRVYAALWEFCKIPSVPTFTHSTAILPADTRDIVVSLACQSSIEPIVCTSLVLFIGRFVPFACTLPVPFGTRFILMLDELPVAVSVIVPVPPAT